MGALLLSDALEKPLRAAHADLGEARAALAELGLGGFEPYLDHLDRSLGLVRVLFKAGRQSEADVEAIGGGFRRQAIDVRRSALASAEAFLTSDLTFRESWEVHRYGLFGRDQVTSRFPAGLALEVLCRAGHDLGGTVDDYLAHLASHRFGYFDDPDFVLRDTDTLGLALRLWRYGARPEGMREELENALEVLVESVGSDGRIPVWLEPPPPGVRLAGEGCGVVEAQMLLGLIAFDAARFEALIARSAAGLLARFEAFGPGISVNYPGMYALDAIRRLAGELESAGIRIFEPEKWERLYRSVLAAELTPPPNSPQEAAFAIAACAGPSVADLRREEWPALIRKHQRPDGSWNAEPFCFVANRGNQATWYSSRTLTTAFCYRALRMI